MRLGEAWDLAAVARANLGALGVKAELEAWGLRLGVQSEARSLRLGEAWNLGLELGVQASYGGGGGGDSGSVHGDEMAPHPRLFRRRRR